MPWIHPQRSNPRTPPCSARREFVMRDAKRPNTARRVPLPWTGWRWRWGAGVAPVPTWSTWNNGCSKWSNGCSIWSRALRSSAGPAKSQRGHGARPVLLCGWRHLMRLRGSVWRSASAARRRTQFGLTESRAARHRAAADRCPADELPILGQGTRLPIQLAPAPTEIKAGMAGQPALLERHHHDHPSRHPRHSNRSS